jgi:phosphoglycerate dehydrogenase-like enzyme
VPPGILLRLLPESEPIPTEARDAEFLVPPYGAVNLAAELARMPRLRVLQTVSAGVEWLPAVPPAVFVCNARGLRDQAVVEWVVGAIFAMQKQIPRLLGAQGRRRREHLRLPELMGTSVLIVGYGSIGRLLGSVLADLGMRVLRLARRARAGVASVDELHDLLPEADVVVLLVPLDASTAGLMDARAIARMRPGALLVNAARGAVVDTSALVSALNARHIRAALDVTEPEPLPAEHPLWRAPGLLLTPHLAGDTPAAERRVYRFIGEQLRRFARGEPLRNVVRYPDPNAEEDRKIEQAARR